jgi:hypothetical protein
MFPGNPPNHLIPVLSLTCIRRLLRLITSTKNIQFRCILHPGLTLRHQKSSGVLSKSVLSNEL